MHWTAAEESALQFDNLTYNEGACFILSADVLLSRAVEIRGNKGVFFVLQTNALASCRGHVNESPCDQI